MDNKLQVTDQNWQAAHGLSRIADALSTPQVRHIDKVSFNSVVQPAIYKAFMSRGQFEIEQEKIDHIVTSFHDAIMLSCPSIRIEEIPIAIEKGILGFYGEFHGLNLVSLTNFVKAHYTSSERLKIANQSPTKEDENKKPSQSEILETDKKLLLHAFDRYKSTGFYEDHGNYLYKVAAKKLNLFSLSPERQKYFLEGGKKIAINKIRGEIVQHPNRHNQLSLELNDANNLVPNTDGIRKVYKESLQLALLDWFKGLVEMETELKDILEP
jgi:hypothetical protein